MSMPPPDFIPGFSRPPLNMPPPKIPTRVPSPIIFTMEPKIYSLPVSNDYVQPLKKISTQEDLQLFLQSEALYRLFNFILLLNESIKNKKISDVKSYSKNIEVFIKLLNTTEELINQVPPEEQPQRFGNKAFRTWMKLHEESAQKNLQKLLPPNLWPSIIELQTYWIHSFGDSTRIDYGSGHELNFAALLCCLNLLGFFKEEDYSAIVLVIFNRYLDIVQNIQKTYRLEPAGSHGVWGLDDFQFLSYLWGSAQFYNHPHMKPKSFINKDIVETYCKDYLFLKSINFIHEMKKGPFFEHSPILYDISGVPNWQKVNRGLIKMYVAEVLKKIPIVQHFFFGCLLPFVETEFSFL